MPRGALVEQLVERGFAVYVINPKQLDRFRERFTTAGAKDDRRDAWVIGDSLRTDPHAYRRIALDDPRVIQLREWARVDEDLGIEVRRISAQQVRTILQQPALYTAPGVTDAVTAHIQVLLPRLELLARQRRDAAHRLERLLNDLEADAPSAGNQREHSDVAIVRFMPGIGTRVAARMLAEASQPLVGRAYHVLRALMGVAPVTKQSGRRRTVSMRYACNGRLREAAYHWARVGVQCDPPSRVYYATLRARGHTHGRALRSVADRLLRILIVLLERGQRFDPTHGRLTSAVATGA